MNILEEIKQNKLREVQERKSFHSIKVLEQSIYFKLQPISLRKHLGRSDLIGIIAEFKRRSPSKGIINQHSEVAATCMGYIQAGATALSVLTDEKYFGGSADDLRLAREMNHCPILRKDFIIDEYQIIEARSIGADVILLIAEMLDEKEIKKLAAFANALGLEVLLELHDKEQLEKLNDNVHLAGINNRNLKTFEVDIEKAVQLASLIPDSFVKVAESGIRDAETLLKLKDKGFKGFLIGEYFMSQPNPAEACSQFIRSIQRIQATSKA